MKTFKKQIDEAFLEDVFSMREKALNSYYDFE